MIALALLAPVPAERPFLWHPTDPLTAGALVARATAIARALPAVRYVVNLCDDRREFMLGFAAALIAGKTTLLPPSRAAEPLRELREAYPDSCVLAGAGCEYVGPDTIPMASLTALAGVSGAAAPRIAADHLAAIVFSSGSTGRPSAHRKTWGALIGTGQELAERFGINAASAIVGTVPPQHMYGLETTILLPLATGALVHAGRPHFPADVATATAMVGGKPWLMTTPLHLRALAAGMSQRLPLAGIVSATMPMPPELARDVEVRWGVPVAEIYGCTEAGSLATRRLTRDPLWVPIGAIEMGADDDGPFVHRGHVGDEKVALTDALELESPRRFRLLGRAANMVKVGGKRTSIEALNAALTQIPGVQDGVFFQPQGENPDGEERLIAFVVAPRTEPRAILDGLRSRIDAVFLPRPLVRVARLPRNDLGKLTRADLEALASSLGRSDAA